MTVAFVAAVLATQATVYFAGWWLLRLARRRAA